MEGRGAYSVWARMRSWAVGKGQRRDVKKMLRRTGG